MIQMPAQLLKAFSNIFEAARIMTVAVIMFHYEQQLPKRFFLFFSNLQILKFLLYSVAETEASKTLELARGRINLFLIHVGRIRSDSVGTIRPLRQ